MQSIKKKPVANLVKKDNTGLFKVIVTIINGMSSHI